MDDRSEKAEKKRINLTLTGVYVEALDRLVEEGIYLEHQVAIRDALRRLFRLYGLDPFGVPEGSPGEEEEEVKN